MRRIGLAVGIAAGVLALVHAIGRIWLCDDAFISFRYADHLAHGHGLVFNLGERVEGDTNFLWTLWLAVGRLLGARPEAWAIAWGLACYAGTIALLAVRSLAIADDPWMIPGAVVLAAAHATWAEFATSGLETSAFTLFVFAGYITVCPESEALPSRGRTATAGALFALAALTRPDGVLFGAVAGAWLLARRRVRLALVLAAGFAAVWVPPTLWRVWYYGDFFPNTYYAKSAWLPWWDQGSYYALLYLRRYLPFILVPFALGSRARSRAALELALVAVYTLYVMRVGGDFMFGRMLVPLTPLLCLSLQRALSVFAPPMRLALTAVAAAVFLLTPFPPHLTSKGVVDEREFYAQRPWATESDARGAALARTLHDLPAVVAFTGAGTRMIYRSRVPIAIECNAGLTDPAIAHQTLVRRGRVGHEKHARPEYLFARGVDFVPLPFELLELTAGLPHLTIDLAGMQALVVTWHPAIMDAVLARGAHFVDLPGQVDQELARLPAQSDDLARREYELFRRAYFDHAPDPAREAPFRARLHP